jgi:hypothetical protein
MDCRDLGVKLPDGRAESGDERPEESGRGRQECLRHGHGQADYDGDLQRTRWVLWVLSAGAVCIAVLWQWATVTANYGGNWSALFCTGAIQRQPPLVFSEHVYLFQGSSGYDGQSYHYMAHDPFLRSDLKNFIDDPRLRYRRILVPLLAHGLAFGRSDWVDGAYRVVCLLSIGFGVFWSCRIAQEAGAAVGWGLLFLGMPAIPITVDRLVVDGSLAALTAGFVLYSRSGWWRVFAVLGCAALTRETGFLLIGAYCAGLAWERAWRSAGLFLLSAAPAMGWYGYVQMRTVGQPYGASLIPFSAIVHAIGNPWRYPPGTPFVNAVLAADYLALGGVLVAFGLAFMWFARRPGETLRIAAVLFAGMAVVVQRTDHWQNVYDFGRVYTPLLVCLGALAAQGRNGWLLAPVAMMLPRVAIQFAPQVLGVVRWIV